MLKAATHRQTMGLLLRAVLLGLVFGGASQVVPLLHNLEFKGILALAVLAGLLGPARRTQGALGLGVAGALCWGGGTVAYFATHLAILNLGWGPANTWDMAHQVDLAQAWMFFKPEIRHWILPITAAGFLIGWAVGAVQRYLPGREAVYVS